MNRDGWVRQLQERYPAPIKSPESALSPPTSYCVGGALARELGFATISHSCDRVALPPMQRGRSAAEKDIAGSAIFDCGCTEEVGIFPDTPALTQILCVGNPDLTPEVAFEFAKLIARKNDTGNFETAWGVVADALAWEPTGGWTAADDGRVEAFLTEVSK